MSTRFSGDSSSVPGRPWRRSGRLGLDCAQWNAGIAAVPRNIAPAVPPPAAMGGWGHEVQAPRLPSWTRSIRAGGGTAGEQGRSDHQGGCGAHVGAGLQAATSRSGPKWPDGELATGATRTTKRDMAVRDWSARPGRPIGQSHGCVRHARCSATLDGPSTAMDAGGRGARAKPRGKVRRLLTAAGIAVGSVCGIGHSPPATTRAAATTTATATSGPTTACPISASPTWRCRGRIGARPGNPDAGGHD